MANFMSSTQLAEWTYEDFDAIASQRREVNKDIPLTFEELLNFQISLERELLRFARHNMDELQIGRTTMHIALSYLKRFYLRAPLVEFHPLLVLLTCVYLALKVDERNPGIYRFVSYARAFLTFFDAITPISGDNGDNRISEIIRECITYYEFVVMEKMN